MMSETVLNVGTRVEPFVDDWLIESMAGVSLKLQQPVLREVSITFDEPWEGNTSAYITVFQDGDLYRMYYRGSNFDTETQEYSPHEVTCTAESDDGIHWRKPRLGVVPFNGSTANNIVWARDGGHNLAPFKDTNSDVHPKAAYKAVSGVWPSESSPLTVRGMYAYHSPDRVHWTPAGSDPIITEGDFDSQNIAFWDDVRGRYVTFYRNSREDVRDIMTAFSDDFVHWTQPEWLDWGDAPAEHLYANAIAPHPRAPHIFVGFPKRFHPSRRLVDHRHPGVSDAVFMTSRDGVCWHRWPEAFIRPGLSPDRWVNRNNMTAWGVVSTKADGPDLPDELSIYVSEGYYTANRCRMRRYTVRQDGFVSAHAAYDGGELLTRPLLCAGDRLVLNFSTSAVGCLRVEVQDESGRPVPGYAMDECPEIFGDALARSVAWESGASLGALRGRPVRLRFHLKDADLYSIRFDDVEDA